MCTGTKGTGALTVLQRLPVWLGDALPHEDKDGMTMNEEHSQAKNRAALVSLLAACLLTAIKLVVGIYTNSLGILSEALHSGLDLLAAAMTLYAGPALFPSCGCPASLWAWQSREPVGTGRDSAAVRYLRLGRL